MGLKLKTPSLRRLKQFNMRYKEYVRMYNQNLEVLK